MKKVTSIIISLFLLTQSCVEDHENLGSIPTFGGENIGAITTLEAEPAIFNLLEDLSTQSISFVVDVDGFGVTEIESVDIELIFTDARRLPNPDPTADPLDSIYDNIIVATVDEFPASFEFSAAELADIVGFGTIDSLDVGDNFNFIFPINTADGRRLTTALNSDLCTQPGQPSFGGCNYTVNVTCPSDINDEVTYTAVATGFGTSTTREVTINESSEGTYQISDLTGGLLGFLLGDPDFEAGGSFVDVCNTITVPTFSPPGIVPISQGSSPGVYDPVTGTITFNWVIVGVESTTVLTPN